MIKIYQIDLFGNLHYIGEVEGEKTMEITINFDSLIKTHKKVAELRELHGEDTKITVKIEKEKRDAQIHDKGKTGDEISPYGL